MNNEKINSKIKVSNLENCTFSNSKFQIAMID